MFPLISEMVEEQRREQFQQESARQRLVAEALRGRSTHTRLSHVLLAGLGRRLEGWGSQLRAHFDEVEYSYR